MVMYTNRSKTESYNSSKRLGAAIGGLGFVAVGIILLTLVLSIANTPTAMLIVGGAFVVVGLLFLISPETALLIVGTLASWVPWN